MRGILICLELLRCLLEERFRILSIFSIKENKLSTAFPFNIDMLINIKNAVSSCAFFMMFQL